MSAAPWSSPPDAPGDRLCSRCLFCRCPFEPSPLADRLPPGDRFAYDPHRGRLWALCARCTRWNLIPVEDRFDAVDVLEREVRDRGELLGATASISLYQTADLLIVRIGRAPLVERVAWRYGREILKRGAVWQLRRTRVAAGTADVLARAGEIFGLWALDRSWGPSASADILRWQRFGNVAWTGRTPCAFCGSILHTLHYDYSWWLRPRIVGGRLVIGVPCTRCDPWTPRNVWDLKGEGAQQLLRRVLAYQNVAGAGEHDVAHASAMIERAGSAERLVGDLATGRTSLWSMGRTHTLALEIAAGHLAERQLLSLRLHGIEAEWRIEEGLARIVDEELS